MEQADRRRFADIVIGFAELRGKQLSSMALELFWNAMKNWSIDEFEQAATHLLKSCKFMPTPFDFEELRKAARPTPGEAFAQVLKHAASSSYRDGLLGYAAIDTAVQALGGYRVIAMCEDEKLPFIERRFCEHYETIKDVADVRINVPSIGCRLDGARSLNNILPEKLGG